MDAPSTWPAGFDEFRRGIGCPMCDGTDADETPHGVRIMAGTWCDAYLGRFPVRRGYCFVIWKGAHVAEPTELSADESCGFWQEVAMAASAVDRRYQPVKMNWLHLGNGVPHLHVHLVPRFADDPRAGGPLEAEAFDRANDRPLDDATLRAEAAALRALIEGASGPQRR